MRGHGLALLAALLLPAPTAMAQQVIRNPVLRGFSPDPSIVRVGADTYIATSTFEYFPGVRLHHSRDLVHWRVLGHALTRRSQLDLRGVPASGGIWAPGLSHDGEMFYLAYTVVRSKEGGFVDGGNFLVTAPSIEGPWSEPVALHSRGFDPQLFHARDGRKWLLNLVWDHRLAKRSGGIELQEYDPVARALVGEPRRIFRGTELGGTEAPQVYERGGWFHLMTAEGGTGYGHAVTMARARRIEGPYEVDPAGPLLTSREVPELALQKAGHAGLVETQGGELFLAFLCARPMSGTRLCPLGRETALARCAWWGASLPPRASTRASSSGGWRVCAAASRPAWTALHGTTTRWRA